MNALASIAGCVANVLAVLLLAPLAEGVLRRLTARIQSRQGPPLLQPYFDLLKLLGKEDLEAGETPWMQRFAAGLAFASVLALACMVPLFRPIPPAAPWADAILVAYLLTLAGISTLLAGLAAGSVYSLLGMSREMMGLLLLEPLLAIALITKSIQVESLRLDLLFLAPPSTLLLPSAWILIGILLWTLPAFVHRPPFDIAEAETELMDGPFLEYSGPKLALLRHAQMAKLVVYTGLLVGLFRPWSASLPSVLLMTLPALAIAGMVLIVTVVAATHARYRIDQAVRRYASLLAAAFVALVLATAGY